MTIEYAVFCGLDVGKDTHHACALDPAGTRLFDAALLVDRGLRLKELQKRRADAMARLAALPAHPWSGNQDAA